MAILKLVAPRSQKPTNKFQTKAATKTRELLKVPITSRCPVRRRKGANLCPPY